MILAGDVGGTKTHLALYAPGSSPRRPVHERLYPSREFPSLEALARTFVDELGAQPTRGVFGIAGPVVDNRCEATNLPWTMDGASLAQAIGATRVQLMNDLEAAAWSLRVLDPEDLLTLQAGVAERGNRALIAAGTGLGESIVHWHDGRWIPMASEGGHVDFAPREPLEDELLVWLRTLHRRVSYERILSGRGLANLYRFMAATGRGDEPAQVKQRFAAAADPAVVVTETALDGSCERAVLALRKFVEIYGAEAGNLALKGLAVGGVFVGGGIAPRIEPFLADGRFAQAFHTKGRLSPVLEAIPVTLIRAPEAGVWGAAACALSWD